MPPKILSPSFNKLSFGLVSAGAAGYTGPGDIVTAGFTGWIGARAYSAAKATSLAVAFRVNDAGSGASGADMDVHLAANGTLNRTDLNTIISTYTGSDGPQVISYTDQTGNATPFGVAALRPLFKIDHYGTDKHAFLNRSSGGIGSGGTWPNTGSGFLFTGSLKSVTGAAGSNYLTFADNTVASWFFQATDPCTISQDPGFTSGTGPAIAKDVQHGVTAFFNGASSAISMDGAETSPINSNGTDAITNGVMVAFWPGGFLPPANYEGSYFSEMGFMTDTKVTANSMNTATRNALSLNTKNFYT